MELMISAQPTPSRGHEDHQSYGWDYFIQDSSGASDWKPYLTEDNCEV